MADLQKRATLKLAVAAGAVGALPALSIANSHHTGATERSDADPVHGFGVSEVLIRINTRAVTFSNLTHHSVQCRHFAPGSVRWDRYSLDLNALRTTPTLAPFTTTTISLTNLSIVGSAANSAMTHETRADEIQADEAIVIGPTGERSILLGGYFYHYQLHLFPIPALNHLSGGLT